MILRVSIGFFLRSLKNIMSFFSKLIGDSNNPNLELSQGKIIQFDISKAQENLHPGEVSLQTVENVQDYKGNMKNKDKKAVLLGKFRITNTRFIW